MSVTSLMTQSVTLERTDTITRDSIGEGSMATQTSTPISAYIEPRTSDEDENTRGTLIGDWVAYVPPGTDVEGWDRVVYGSRTFDIVGPARPFVNPRSSTDSHIVLDLREVV